jgi:anaerobic selenocysteine-containing dehydrogenase
VPFFRHTENRNNPLLREHCPEAILYLHPRTAAALGVAAGEWVTVQTPTGRACSRAVLTEGIAPDVVQAVPGWGGEQNINRVIPWEGFAEGIGTVPMRGLPCRLIRGRQA